MNTPTPLDHELQTLYQLPAPHPDFATRLQRDLRARAENLETTSARKPSFPQIRWQGFHQAWSTAALLIILIAAAVLVFVGPQRVWAEIQRFFRYVPGVGFIDLENARVLAAPVAIEREGITLIVTQVIASQSRTFIRLETQGLPPERQIWPQGAEFDENFQVTIRLPDGKPLEPQGLMMGFGSGQIEFPPLPPNTTFITLELNQLPLTPPGMFPENWIIALPLHPVNGDLDETLFPEPYMPENARDTHFGITVQVLQVAHAPEGTAIQLQIVSNSPAWSTRAWDFYLLDDIGHTYSQSYEYPSNVQTMIVSPEELQSDNNPNAYVETYLFYPLSLSARQLTLEISAMSKDTPVDSTFTVDLGDNPQIGDTWPLDIPLEIAGLTARITGARLVEVVEDNEINLEFFIQAEPAEDGQIIDMMQISNRQVGLWSGGGSEGARPGEGSMKAYLSMDVGTPLPHGVITIKIDEVSIYYPGPWLITWPISHEETDPDQFVRPVILRPADARDTRSGLTLSISETIQTDRVFALTLHPENLPRDAVFLRPTIWGTDRFNRSRITLSDNLGNIQDSYNWNVSWGSFLDIDKIQTHLNFAPPNPLATRMTLTIPAVQLFLPEETSFDVTLPPGMSLLSRPMIDPSNYPPPGSWEVDIPIEVAGFQVHFTRAWLEEGNNSVSLVLFADDVEGQMGEYYLSGLQMASVLTPNGNTWIPEPYPNAYGFAGPLPGGSYGAELSINALDPQQFKALSGTYHIQLEGVVVTLQGPWKLSWDSLGP